MDQNGGGTATGSVLFIGTATVLIRVAGFTVLTDPNFLHSGEHVRLGWGLRSRRLTDPALEIDALPPLDLVVVSHLHGDHFDQVAEERLDRDVPIVTTPHAAASLGKMGFRAPRGVATWRSEEFTNGDARLRVTSMPGRHAPRPLYALLPRVMGSMLEFSMGTDLLLRLYISGDTLIHDRLASIPRRYPEIDLALLHLGGTRIAGLLLTMDAVQGVEALQLIQPRNAIPIHYNDYPVFRSPLEDFRTAIRGSALEQRVHFLRHGETFTFPLPYR